MDIHFESLGASDPIHFYPGKTVVGTEECDAFAITSLQRHTIACGTRMVFRLSGPQVVFAPNTIKSLFTETAHKANIRSAEATTEVGETL